MGVPNAPKWDQKLKNISYEQYENSKLMFFDGCILKWRIYKLGYLIYYKIYNISKISKNCNECGTAFEL